MAREARCWRWDGSEGAEGADGAEDAEDAEGAESTERATGTESESTESAEGALAQRAQRQTGVAAALVRHRRGFEGAEASGVARRTMSKCEHNSS